MATLYNAPNPSFMIVGFPEDGYCLILYAGYIILSDSDKFTVKLPRIFYDLLQKSRIIIKQTKILPIFNKPQLCFRLVLLASLVINKAKKTVL